MDPRLEAFRRVDAVFDAALDLPTGERAAFLDRTCAGDAALRDAVERLLAAHDRSDGFLAAPAAGFVAPLLDTPDALEGMPERVGPYRVVRELGSGGMGTVYLAVRDDDQHFHQRVALKLVPGAIGADWKLKRFLAERRILASLEHPHIARLYDGGTTPDGAPWFAMEYVEGEPLDRYCDAHALTLEQRLRLFRDVCAAVRYAHAQGVVHRDLKPSNIFVTADGEAKLLDFGIAKLLDPGADGDAPRTGTGMQLMTPEYAAPEQVRGREATPAADVYSLGLLLYALIVGQRPYRTAGLTPAEIERVVCDSDPPRPSAAARRARRRWRVDADLDTIVCHAMQKDPARRYPSAAELLEDLSRHAEGRPVLARPDTFAYRARKLIVRHRRPVATVVLLLVAVPLLAVALVAIKGPAPRGEPSLIATGALHARDRLLVADFADHAGDPTLAAAVTEAVRTDLTQSPLVRVLTPRQVRVMLERMERSPDLALDDTLARELAAREGVKAIVTGSVAKAGDSYTVAVQLVGAERGDALAAYRETAATSSELIAAVDRVSRRLRERVGESLRDLRDRTPLADAATGSLEALRLFTEATRLTRTGDRPGAIRLYQRAIAIDTGFGAAHTALAMAYNSMSEPGRAAAASRHALANLHRLPFKDRYFVVASHAYRSGQYDSAAATYERVIERYPDEVRAWNNLALVRQDQRRYAAAESLFARAAAVDSTIANFYFGIHGAQLMQGKFAEARRTLAYVARRFPDNSVVGTISIQHAAAQQDWALTERRAREKLEVERGDTAELSDPYEALAGTAMAQGRLAEAERLWRTQYVVAAAAEAHTRLLFGVVQRGYLALRYRGDTAHAVAIVDSALRRFPLDSILPGDRPYDELARFYASAGQPARARAFLAGANANDRLLDRLLRADRAWTRGVIALAERRPALAVSELRTAAESHPCSMCALPALARAEEAAGDPRAAIASYERYLSTPWFWRYEPDAVELGWAIKRLAELKAAQGDARGAAEVRGRLDRLWAKADPELKTAAEGSPAARVGGRG